MRATGRTRRHLRIRRKLQGRPERPRLCVYRSLRNVYGSIVDDVHSRTIATVSTLTREIRDLKLKSNIERAKAVGKVLARLAKDKNVSKVCFDRGGYKYHGQVKSLAEGAREGGLKF